MDEEKVMVGLILFLILCATFIFWSATRSENIDGYIIKKAVNACEMEHNGIDELWVVDGGITIKVRCADGSYYVF